MAFEVLESRGGRFRWQYREESGRVVSESDGSYASRSDAERAIETFKQRIIASETTASTKPRKIFPGLSPKDVLLPLALGLFTLVGSYAGARFAVEGDVKVKAAELAFAGNPTVGDVQSRVQTLVNLFPAELKEWQPAASAGTTGYLFPSINTARWAFLQLAVQKVGCADQIAQLWNELYGPAQVTMPPSPSNDAWITAVTPLTPCPVVAAPAPTAQ